MSIRNLTCITCPRGCSLAVELDEGGNVLNVTGNFCPRGVEYGKNECTHPVRTVTSTVKTSDGGVVAVKTNRAIPKELMFDCMKAINGVTVTLPTHTGDVVIANVLGTGADVVVTAEKE